MIVLAHVHERARFIQEYARPTAELIGRFGGEYLVRAPHALALENAAAFDGAAVVVSKWPDRAAIERFWNSEAYAALKAAREPLADAHVLVVEEPS